MKHKHQPGTVHDGLPPHGPGWHWHQVVTEPLTPASPGAEDSGQAERRFEEIVALTGGRVIANGVDIMAEVQDRALGAERMWNELTKDDQDAVLRLVAAGYSDESALSIIHSSRLLPEPLDA